MKKKTRKVGSDLLGISEASEQLGVSTSTIWRLLRRGALPSVRKGNRRLIPARALRVRTATPRSTKLTALGKDHPIYRLIGAASSAGKPDSSDKYGVLSS